MRILMIGLDKSLVGAPGGDAIARHREYGERVESLDIIVYTRKDESFGINKISPKVTAYPTVSGSKVAFIFNALAIASRIYAKNKFDLVVAQDPFGMGFVGCVLKLKFKIKLQINFHGDFWENDYWRNRSLLSRVYIPVSKFLVTQADGIRVVSAGIREKLIRNRVSESKIAVLPTPVNFGAFEDIDESAVQRQKEEWKGRKVILYAGRLTPEKNLPGLLRSFRDVKNSLPEAFLVIAGAGPLQEQLARQVLDVGLEKDVIFAGALSHQRLAEYYVACDVVVLPSFSESFGKVLVEAALAKKPVVATATTGGADIVVDGVSGYLAPIGDNAVLAQRLLEVLNNDSLARGMGEEGYRIVRERFDRKKIVDGIINFWLKILQNQT